MPIEHISDTARWVALHRAMESARPDALFRDPFARRLAGERGEEVAAAIPGGRRVAWAMIVRTAVFDEILLDRVRRGDADTVLNLAAGLDARPWRLPLPADCEWIDVDFAETLDYKAGILAGETPACRYRAVAADLAQPGALAGILAGLGPGRRILVLSEGLLVYLTAEQVTALARDLHREPSVRWWLMDLDSPQLVERLNRSWGPALARGNARFQFAPAEGTAFFAPLGWREVEWRSLFEEARRLEREAPGMGFWRLVARLLPARKREEIRRLAALVLLERDDRAEPA